jgi:hypothetical protein
MPLKKTEAKIEKFECSLGGMEGIRRGKFLHGKIQGKTPENRF